MQCTLCKVINKFMFAYTRYGETYTAQDGDIVLLLDIDEMQDYPFTIASLLTHTGRYLQLRYAGQCLLSSIMTELI